MGEMYNFEYFYDDIINKKTSISIIGLGYVGLPIAIAFSKKVDVIGFDISAKKIELYRNGYDPTGEVGDDEIRESKVYYTSKSTDIKKAKFHIIAVPTPVKEDHTPDLKPLTSATQLVADNLKRGDIVVYESTVYPGVTEEVCIPILESKSGLACGKDFKVGYSPERINPGDKKHRLSSIIKVVSGIDEETLDIIAKVYELVVDAGVYRAESIKVAEAAKVIENSQRDINIAFMNELSIIFSRMGIDTKAVLKAAETKWNFLKFYPGLVGGHCIGVDPYYLTYKAEMLGYHSQVILAGRRINDNMGKYVGDMCVKLLSATDRPIKDLRVGIAGFTFKENCPDTRNTKVIDIVNELQEFGIEPMVYDPVADINEAKQLYGISLVDADSFIDMDAIIIAVAHKLFRAKTVDKFEKMFGKENQLVIDLKGIYDRCEFEAHGYKYWRL